MYEHEKCSATETETEQILLTQTEMEKWVPWSRAASVWFGPHGRHQILLWDVMIPFHQGTCILKQYICGTLG